MKRTLFELGCGQSQTLGLKKYKESEPLLLSAYDGMKQCEDKVPAEARPRLTEAIQRLVQLSHAWGKPDRALEWEAKLSDLGKLAIPVTLWTKSVGPSEHPAMKISLELNCDRKPVDSRQKGEA